MTLAEQVHELQIPASDSFEFKVGSETIISFHGNGDIYVKGRLVENDKEVVDGFRMLLSAARGNDE